MNFNPDITRITQTALTKLKGKTFGGVDKGSAKEAVEYGVNEIIRQSNDAIGQVQREMNILKNKTAQEISKMESEKDTAVFQAKQHAEKEIATANKNAQDKIRAAKAPKIFEKLLPNGNKLIRKSNQNGAVMEKEMVTVIDKNTNEPVEKVLTAKVQNLAGDVRKTTFDVITGKPLKTYTDTIAPKQYIYKNEFETEVKDVNVKKVISPKPTLIGETEPVRVSGHFMGETGFEIERLYSDGSKVKLTKLTDSYHDNNRLKIYKTDKNGNRLEDTIIWSNGNSRSDIRLKDNTDRHIEKFKREDNTEVVKYYDTIYDSRTCNRYTTGFGEKNAKISYSAKLQKDEFDIYTNTYKAKIKFPKDSGRKPIIIEGDMGTIQKQIKELQK